MDRHVCRSVLAVSILVMLLFPVGSGAASTALSVDAGPIRIASDGLDGASEPAARRVLRPGEGPQHRPYPLNCGPYPSGLTDRAPSSKKIWNAGPSVKAVCR